ncbi:mitochondrial ATP synthase epsilon chain-domain-containing protein, partial [Scleroderma citrinum]
MSSATWRNFFTYNKYAQITARAVRQSLKENERLLAEKRGVSALRYQKWENGAGGQQV